MVTALLSTHNFLEYINMIRLFYDPETGIIHSWMTKNIAHSDGYFIDVPKKVNIKQWRVNPSTLELIPCQDS